MGRVLLCLVDKENVDFCCVYIYIYIYVLRASPPAAGPYMVTNDLRLVLAFTIPGLLVTTFGVIFRILEVP